MSDYYKTLGIQRGADKNAIKRAYHKMARKFHPDKNRDGGRDTTERFKEIKEAYEVLSDDGKRSIYDRHGKEGLKRMNSGGPPSGSPFDMFNQMFRGGPFGGFGMNVNMNQRRRKRGSNINHVHYFTLEDFYKRVPLIVTYERECVCVKCKGLGVADSTYIKTCGACNGSGTINRVRQMGPGMIQHMTSTCRNCRGEGKIITPGGECKKCKGIKKEKRRETVQLDMPDNLCDGSRVGIAGRGCEEPDGITGDLEITFRQSPHPYLTRCRNHLLYKHDLILGDALLGCNYNFVHLDGRKLNIVEENPISPYKIYIIPGEGLNGGDLYIKYRVIFPEVLDDSTRTSLEAIFKRDSTTTKETGGVPIKTVLKNRAPPEVQEQI